MIQDSLGCQLQRWGWDMCSILFGHFSLKTAPLAQQPFWYIDKEMFKIQTLYPLPPHWTCVLQKLKQIKEHFPCFVLFVFYPVPYPLPGCVSDMPLKKKLYDSEAYNCCIILLKSKKSNHPWCAKVHSHRTLHRLFRRRLLQHRFHSQLNYPIIVLWVMYRVRFTWRS